MQYKSLAGTILGSGLAGYISSIVNANRLLVVYYHHVLPKEKMENLAVDDNFIDTETFERQLEFFSRRYRCVTDIDIARAIENGDRLGQRSVCITFDDGFADNYKYVFPLLEKYGLKATFYITTSRIRLNETNKEFMSWEELKELVSRGHSIGAHTISHRILSRLSPEEIETEIAGSKRELEEKLNIRVVSFAYPHGKAGDIPAAICEQILKKHGFSMAVTTLGGFVPLSGTFNPFWMSRIGFSKVEPFSFFLAKAYWGAFWQR
ncbi:MAG: polysaccharide deacetylase family protein [Candidatus Omnitrophota bacterium]|nr:polysaccharide deacetylase family protein [Candidatus Omnitrophota bacterium]